ncbi:uncharacterized protein LOC127719814 [Mytilus californianus]|uniref:uncharacterized protein LOC127719814 n=1 Tax=Mytilus californianus TaxID=6549 RepID=UPI00224843EE|nr:uncharacterized protein LOC127719814 [Mytilus californianus]
MASEKYDNELTENELAKLYTYTQTIQVGEENLKTDDAIKNAESHIHGYIQNALNDHSLSSEAHPNIQIPFYDARLNIEKNDGNYTRIYTINFNILSIKFWNDKVRKKLVGLYFGALLQNVTSAKLVSERVVELLKAFKRDPTSYDALTHDVEPGCSNIPGDNCWEKFLSYWLVVPRVQWDFFDLLYQMYTFDIFHQGVIPKYVHVFTIPTNVMLSMMFLVQFNMPSLGELRYGNAFAVNFALVLFFVLGVAYIIMGILRKSWAWGVATFLVLGVLNMTGNLWYYSYRTKDNSWYNPTNLYTHPLIWSYAISLIQASSHMAVP